MTVRSLIGASLLPAACLAAGCDSGQEAGTVRTGSTSSLGDRRSVRVEPERAGLRAGISLTFPTPYSLGDQTRNGVRAGELEVGPRKAQSYDNYHVIYEGPRGRGCSYRSAKGYPTGASRTRTRTILITPRQRWCPGRYLGRVEYRQPDRAPAIPFEILGWFSFVIAPSD